MFNPIERSGADHFKTFFGLGVMIQIDATGGKTKGQD